jgi:hypothetical protein
MLACWRSRFKDLSSSTTSVSAPSTDDWRAHAAPRAARKLRLVAGHTHYVVGRGLARRALLGDVRRYGLERNPQLMQQFLAAGTGGGEVNHLMKYFLFLISDFQPGIMASAEAPGIRNLKLEI